MTRHWEPHVRTRRGDMVYCVHDPPIDPCLLGVGGACKPGVAPSMHDSSMCALFTSLDLGFVRVFRAYHVYQLYRQSPAVLDPLATPDWTLYYRNATCCPPAPSPPPVTPARIFGPGSCPAIRYDKRSGYWYAGLVPPGALAAGAGYRV